MFIVGIQDGAALLQFTTLQGRPSMPKQIRYLYFAGLCLYVLVSRVIPTRSSDEASKNLQNILQTVSYWLHLLPGFYILLVVTHIDEVDSTTLKNQREKVQEYVIDQLEK